MVTERYLLRRPRPPGAARLFVDQRLVPVAIDLAAMAEACAEHVSISARRQPRETLAVAFGIAFLVGWRRR